MDRRRRRRKFLATTFLRALGYGTDDELLGLFYSFKKLSLKQDFEEEEVANYVFKEDVTLELGVASTSNRTVKPGRVEKALLAKTTCTGSP